MGALRQLWTKVARFAKALQGIDDPHGHYMLCLEERMDKLEHDVEHLEGQLGSRAGLGTVRSINR